VQRCTMTRACIDRPDRLRYNRCMHLFPTTLALAVWCCLACLPTQAATVETVSETACAQMKLLGVLKENSPASCHRLRIVKFSYVDFAGATRQDGEIMVLDAAADHVRGLFEELLRCRFPIARARPMQHYGGDDMAAMRDNNTSAFNHRALTGGGALSLHAYGLAIDINPVQNPYLAFEVNGQAQVSPEAGIRYANRIRQRPGKSLRQGMTEEVVQVFANHGFLIWGGDWDDPIDYQHFQVSRRLAEQLAALPTDRARELFERHVRQYRDCLRAARSAGRLSPFSTDSAACRHSD
jgi:hypothetical protein